MKFYNSDITKTNSECIINPSTGLGVFHKGISKSILREGGPEVLNSSKEVCFYHGLYRAGEAYLGKSGFLQNRGIKSIAHAVIIKRSPQKAKLNDCENALKKCLELILEQKYLSVAVPSLVIEPRNINEKQCAEMMMNVLKKYDEKLEISVIDTNVVFIQEFKRIHG